MQLFSIMKSIQKHLFKIILTLAASFSYAQSKEFKIVMGNYPASLMPLFTDMVSNRLIAGFMLRPVTAYDPNGVLSCILCEELPTFSNGLAKKIQTKNGERISVTYKLKEGFVWNNNKPLTSDDVIFSWQVGADTKVPVADRSCFRFIDEIRKIDARTFEVIHEVTAEYNSLNNIYIFNSELDQPVYQQNPDKYHENSVYLKDPNRKGLYLGPYQFESAKTGNHVVLARNPNWKGAKAPFEKIRLLAISEPTTLTANLLAGKIDLAVHLTAIPTDQLQNLSKLLPSHRLVSVSGTAYDRMAFNFRRPEMNSALLRQALTLALDRTSILKNLLSSRYKAANAPFLTMSDPSPRERKKEEALKLFSQAGWKLENGKLINSEKQQLKIKLVTTSDNVERMNIAQAAQHQWGEIGINVNVQGFVAKALYAKVIPDGDYDIEFSGRYTDGEMGSVLRDLFHSENIPYNAAAGGSNEAAYKNAQVDVVLNKLERESDKNERELLVKAFMKEYEQDPPEIPLFYRMHDYLAPKGLQFNPSMTGSPISLWAENWKLN